MATNTLFKLIDFGQSYWLDNLSREKIKTGELEQRVSEQGLRGITSNPDIFNKAIAGSKDYDEQIRDLALKGYGLKEIYNAITVKDVQDACDSLLSVYEESDGIDGFVSLEIDPSLARDTEGSMNAARYLHQSVSRKNCMIKIPGTKQGLPAIEEMIYEGIPINITLLFSVERYTEVAEAYIRALQRRLKDGKKIDGVKSVASLFLSRIDTAIDRILSEFNLASHEIRIVDPQSLIGKSGTATAYLAYQRFLETFNSENWNKLKSEGAHVQRLLWASTSNKDPFFPELRYVEPLIFPGTVNTLPEKTINVLERNGVLKKNKIEDNLVDARMVFEDLDKLNIRMSNITQQLEHEGIQKFNNSFHELMMSLSLKHIKIMENTSISQKINSGSMEPELKKLYASLDEKQAGKRLFGKDVALWLTKEEQRQSINKALGWISLPESMLKQAKDFMDFSKKIKDEGYTSIVLLGMGGSSLCSEVARETFGPAKGYPQLLVLDNTDPSYIKEFEKNLQLEKTLFIVASKSGTTLETTCFFRYFYDQLKTKSNISAGNNFVAITDDGTPLVKLAEEYQFRRTFINAPNVGGRYSVLSDFGILPMALMGIDVKEFLKRAEQMTKSCGPSVPSEVNPGISLGAMLGLAQRKGRDKLTIVLSSSIRSFGYWIEQLIAESTGKDGKGIIPVTGEKLEAPDEYSNDRIFVHIYLASDSNEKDELKISKFEKAGHPVIKISLPDKMALAEAYYQWEIATAIAGMIIGVNPFDQPNVTESKNNTNQILEEWKKEGRFKEMNAVVQENGMKLFGSEKTTEAIKDNSSSSMEFIQSFLDLAHSNEYVALLPYFDLQPKRKRSLDKWREQISSEFKVATTLLNGPRYLHSTGQLHKGGPDSGLFILMIGEEHEELPIPGQKYNFGILHQAQALGDFRSLSDKGRRVIFINLGKNIDSAITKLTEAIKEEKIISA